MKKILSFLIILGAITFINIDLFAYTFNGSYDFSNVDLNASLSELNGASLNDLFDYDYINYEYLGELPNGVRNKFELNNGVINFAKRVKLREYDHDTSVILITNYNNTGYDRVILDKPYDYINYQVGFSNTDHIIPSLEIGTTHLTYNAYYSIYTMSFFYTTGTRTSGLDYFNDFIKDTKVYYEINVQYDNTIEQTLLFYNLSNINIDLLNYYYAVYLLNKFNLPVGDLWQYAYNAGYSNGYDTGNLQGYNDGYDEGLFDYHTGNYYGQYDYTLSEPYDQATQANISLLSVFSLIIGVAMSMLGFIINIDIFGISIASILGTLAIGVSIVWLLKLIRG